MHDIISTAAGSELARRIEEWSRLAQGAFARSTERGWRAHWASFSAWCATHGKAALPADPSAVAEYLRDESDAGRAWGTIQHRASTITRAHKAAGLANPCETEDVRLALRAIIRRGTDQRQAAALGAHHAARILGKVDSPDARPKDVRDLALMLVGRDLLARGSELVSITVERVTFDDEGADIMLRRHKTSFEELPYRIGRDAAAVLRRWLAAAGIASGPVFVGLTKGGRSTGHPLSCRDVSRILKALGERAGIEGLSSHSLRIGMAQDLTAANIAAPKVLQAAGWRSVTMLTRYTRKLDSKRGALADYYAARK